MAVVLSDRVYGIGACLKLRGIDYMGNTHWSSATVFVLNKNKVVLLLRGIGELCLLGSISPETATEHRYGCKVPCHHLPDSWSYGASHV